MNLGFRILVSNLTQLLLSKAVFGVLTPPAREFLKWFDHSLNTSEPANLVQKRVDNVLGYGRPATSPAQGLLERHTRLCSFFAPSFPRLDNFLWSIHARIFREGFHTLPRAARS